MDQIVDTATPSPDTLLRIIAAQTEIAKLGLDLGSVMAYVTEQVPQLTGASGAAVEFAEGDDMVYRAASGSAAGMLGLRLRRSGSLSGLCVTRGELLHCKDSESDPRVDAVRNARRMFVAAMQQHARTTAARTRRGPVTIERRFAVARDEVGLAGRACVHAVSLVSLFESCGGALRRRSHYRRQPPASAIPACTRRTTVTIDSTISTRHSHAARLPTGRPKPIHSANAPSASARSLLPNGPS